MKYGTFHWHATPECFRCKSCKCSLLGKPFLGRSDGIYCSSSCSAPIRAEDYFIISQDNAMQHSVSEMRLKRTSSLGRSDFMQISRLSSMPDLSERKTVKFDVPETDDCSSCSSSESEFDYSAYRPRISYVQSESLSQRPTRKKKHRKCIVS